MSKTIAVLGAGNGGTAATAHLTHLGHRVRLFSRSQSSITPIVEAGGIVLDGVAGAGFITGFVATSDLREAVVGSDLIMLVVPATAIDHYARLLADHLVPGQPIFLNPGGTGGALALRHSSDGRGFPGRFLWPRSPR